MKTNEYIDSKLNEDIEKIRLKNELLIYQSRFAEMRESIQNIAHQWRQPLNQISATLMNLEYKIENKNLTDEYLLKNIKDIDDITNNLSNTLDEFLKFFKPDMRKQRFNIVNIYKDILKFINHRLTKNNNIQITYSTHELFMQNYRNELTQVLLILINNSIDALDINKNKDTCKIEITHHIENDYFIIQVYDNIMGINKKIIDKIWEPYSSTKIKNKNIGIGLYIAKIIVENHLNGTISIESKNNETKFTIKVPLER